MPLADSPDGFSERSWASPTFQVFKCLLEWGTSWWFPWAPPDLSAAAMLQFYWLLPPAKEQTVRDHIEIYITPIHVFISHIFRNAAGFLDALALRTSHPRRHTRFPSCVQALCAKQRSHKLIKLFSWQAGKKEVDQGKNCYCYLYF